MLKNFFKTASRNILKHKSYSAINFIGLTCGIALALLIISYVRSEVSFDRFHQKADRLYRLSYTAPNGLQLASSPPPIAVNLKNFFPEVEEVARVYGRNVSITRPNESEAFEENGVFFADSALMKMFTFEFVKGNPERALVGIVSVESTRKSHFPRLSVIFPSRMHSLQLKKRNRYIVGVRLEQKPHEYAGYR